MALTPPKPHTRVLLYSGGMDSWIIRQLWKPDVCLYIDTGSEYAEEERRRLPDDVVIERLDLRRFERSDSIIPLRNLYFALIATQYGDDIMLGATASDSILDKSILFAEQTSTLLTYLYQEQKWTEARTITLHLDYKEFTKTELLREFLAQGGDIVEAFHETFSCYHPTPMGEECWNCRSCMKKWIAFANHHYVHPCRIPEMIEREILPSLREGTFDRGEKEQREIRQAMYVELMSRATTETPNLQDAIAEHRRILQNPLQRYWLEVGN